MYFHSYQLDDEEGDNDGYIIFQEKLRDSKRKY